MTKLLLTILLSTSLSTFALDLNFWFDSFCYESPNVQNRNGVFYLPNQQEPVTGENLCVYTNGQYHSKGNILNGMRDGKWTHWHENGQKEKVETYIKGDLNSEIIYKNGWKKEKINYKDGKLDGKNTEWYENGQVNFVINYKDDKWHGMHTQWYENGQMWQEGNYIDNLENGMHTSWHENGQKNSEVNTKDGKLDGKITMWHENGQISIERIYKNGKCISGDC